MILEFDLGNTRCKWRIRNGNEIIAHGYQSATAPFGELEPSLGLYLGQIKNIWVVSVVGEKLELDLISWCQGVFHLVPEFARASDVCAGVVNGYFESSLLGVDRWLGIVGGYNRLKKAFILASFGTAITVDLVLRDGRHVGGFIAPGVNLMLDSLMQRTRQVTVEKDFKGFSIQPGITTTEAVYAALTAMTVGLIENALTRLCEFEPRLDIEVIFTGGDASKFLPFYPEAQQIPDLVLDGLRYIFNDPKNLER